ncbi:cytochrome c biogenesis protein CcmG, thiol:disulfide interchange protein DsbE [Micromonospora pattaloongensis]|uniref:Cytochrome c biogenesis protein CcmG, thiol:disulfide interchange protein DsbE n=1 Tax=Micromonospora pattaloongensis TaxID=405436 RepID=A0A1H3RGL8_9ACTN|nr:TlpA disulfide reductase family protein [Micromonospora pattaloongensis]SDZ24806.1 cytochrome c biogenesis protein CcmG, thiol:disulfide interchange protein DsbE [Micromonospora pattaloongensis]
MTGRLRGLLPALLVAALALGACSSPAREPDARPPAGGAQTLPGPPPADLALRPPPATAPAAPSFTATLTDGTGVAAATLWADRPVVLLFVSSWCTTCADRQRALADLARRYRDRVVFVGVAGEDEPAALDGYLREHGVEHPVVIDGSMTVWRSYAMREPPGVVLISRGGRLLRGWPGGVDAATLDAQLRALALAP